MSVTKNVLINQYYSMKTKSVGSSTFQKKICVCTRFIIAKHLTDFDISRQKLNNPTKSGDSRSLELKQYPLSSSNELS